MSRKINQAGLSLIKQFEGFEPVAYLCPAGVPTIGYGHTKTVTAQDVRSKRTISEDEAEALLMEDVRDAESAVERLITVPLTDNQFSSLVSWTFNLGEWNLKSSTLRRKLNRGDYQSVPGEMARWVRAGSITLAGLIRRRKAEGALFASNGEV